MGAGLSWVQLHVEAALVLLLPVPLRSPLPCQASVFFVGSVPQRQSELVGSGVQPSMLRDAGSVRACYKQCCFYLFLFVMGLGGKGLREGGSKRETEPVRRSSGKGA